MKNQGVRLAHLVPCWDTRILGNPRPMSCIPCLENVYLALNDVRALYLCLPELVVSLIPKIDRSVALDYKADVP
jgi:hypothetical protein